MKFFDAILGKSSLPKPKVDGLFAISTAAVTLEANLGLRPGKRAGICFKPFESSRYESASAEIQELLQYSCKETGTCSTIQKDEYGYLWVLLEDKDFEDLVTNIHLVSGQLIESGFGERLLCAVYRFQKAEEEQDVVYWIFSFKEGNYYPFVPKPNRGRDSPIEFRLRSVMGKELPIEKNEEKLYPLWGMPL